MPRRFIWVPLGASLPNFDSKWTNTETLGCKGNLAVTSSPHWSPGWFGWSVWLCGCLSLPSQIQVPPSLSCVLGTRGRPSPQRRGPAIPAAALPCQNLQTSSQKLWPKKDSKSWQTDSYQKDLGQTIGKLPTPAKVLSEGRILSGQRRRAMMKFISNPDISCCGGDCNCSYLPSTSKFPWENRSPGTRKRSSRMSVRWIWAAQELSCQFYSEQLRFPFNEQLIAPKSELESTSQETQPTTISIHG